MYRVRRLDRTDSSGGRKQAAPSSWGRSPDDLAPGREVEGITAGHGASPRTRTDRGAPFCPRRSVRVSGHFQRTRGVGRFHFAMSLAPQFVPPQTIPPSELTNDRRAVPVPRVSDVPLADVGSAVNGAPRGEERQPETPQPGGLDSGRNQNWLGSVNPVTRRHRRLARRRAALGEGGGRPAGRSLLWASSNHGDVAVRTSSLIPSEPKECKVRAARLGGDPDTMFYGAPPPELRR